MGKQLGAEVRERGREERDEGGFGEIKVKPCGVGKPPEKGEEGGDVFVHVGDGHSNVVRECPDGDVGEVVVDGAQEVVQREGEEKRREGAPLSDSCRDGESGEGAGGLGDGAGVEAVEGMEVLEGMGGETKSPKGLQETVVCQAGEGRLEVPEDGSGGGEGEGVAYALVFYGDNIGKHRTPGEKALLGCV